MKVPKQIISASGLPENETKHIKYIGKYKGRDVFHYAEPDVETGFPFIYLWEKEDNSVEEITGFDALKITCSLVKG